MNKVSYDAQVDAVLHGNNSDVITRLRRRFDEAAGPARDKLILFGLGWLGKTTLARLQAAGIEPIALSDNNAKLWNTELGGVPVLSPEEAVRRFGSTATFVVTVFNPSPPLAQLLKMGAAHVVHFALLYWKHADTMLPLANLAVPSGWDLAADQIHAAYDLLGDESSRQEFLAQLQWRLTLDSSALPPPQPAADTYFPHDLLQLNSHEVFVDCGAFDGDTLRDIVRRTGGKFERCFLFEPDPDNCLRLKNCVGNLEPRLRERVVVQQLAVGSEPGTLKFAATGTAGSTATAGDGIEVECQTLDAALAGCDPTYIKMDIEGAEISALQGAAQVLLRDEPILAICLYHKPEDLWEIPLLVNRLNPGYRLFLRRYAEDCWETVLYAITPRRAGNLDATAKT